MSSVADHGLSNRCADVRLSSQISLVSRDFAQDNLAIPVDVQVSATS
jgi:hypothetical protein